MSTEIVLTGVISLASGVLAKIVFDWLKNGRGKKNNPNGLFKEMLGELREIKDAVLWSNRIHDNMDPMTGQPRWYNTGLVQEVKGMKDVLADTLKLERKNREMLLRMWAHMTGGTDPGGTGE